MLNIFDPRKRSAAARLMRLDKPIGIYLVLWPTLLALWFAAEGVPNTNVLIVFVLGVFVMRAAGCVINDYNDRYIDAHVARTKDRPLPAGDIEPSEALQLFAVLMAIALALVLMTNKLTILLAFGGAALAMIYPLMKRFVYFPQIVLGMAFGWAVPMAFTAQTGSVTPITGLLFIATLLWTTAYDTIYAMVDRDDDIKIGVRSTAILFGDSDRVAIGVTQALFIFTLFLIGGRAEMGIIYYVGVAAAGALFIYQQLLIKDQYPDQCFKAFLNNNYVGLAVYVATVADFWLQRPAL